METDNVKKSHILPALIVGLSLVASTALASWVYSNARAGDTISVTGSAKRQVISDMVKWNMGIMRTVRISELQSGYAQLARDLVAVKDFLKTSGIKDEDIMVSPVAMEENWSYNDKISAPTEKYYLRQPIVIQSEEVEKVSEVAKNVESLIKKGVVLSTFSSLEYYYSKLAELRVGLLADAVRDAKARAEKILEPSGGKVGKMKNASSGVVQVMPLNSVEVADYGMYDTQNKDKEVMVTVRATFIIK